MRNLNRKPKFLYRVNDQIRAESLRVLGHDGKQIGVMTRFEALTKAREQGVDLIEIAPKAVPPVAKIIDIGKFKYQEEKKLKKQKRGQKGGELKEIRFSPFIGDKDYKTRLLRAQEFLKASNKVRAVVKFKGSEMGSKQFGYKLIERLTNDLGDSIVTDMVPKFLGRHLVTVISPVFKSKSAKENEAHGNEQD